jgi:hypothetical protein
MFSPPALGPPGGLGAGTKDTLASLGHNGKRTSPLPPSSTRRASAPLRRGLHFGRLAPSYSSNSFEYNDPAEFERADDLLVRRPFATVHHADH